MKLYIVIYQEQDTGSVYAWLGSADSPSRAEEKFWQALTFPHGREIKCVSEFKSHVAEAYLALYGQTQETESDQDGPVPLQAPLGRYRSNKPIYVEFITTGGHTACTDFRDSLPNGVRAIEAILGKWTNSTPDGKSEQYTGGRIYNNSTGSLICYGTVEDGSLRWYEASGELIVNLKVLGKEEYGLVATKPTLKVNLSGPEGAPHKLIVLVLEHLTGQLVDQFRHDVQWVLQQYTDGQFSDLLDIVSAYVCLVDTSGRFPEYRLDRTAVIAAVKHFNRQLQTLPETVTCLVAGIYPAFDSPGISPGSYQAMVHEEIKRVEDDIEQFAEGREAMQQYLAMLNECAQALRQAGI